jgi:hypothetical protein
LVEERQPNLQTGNDGNKCFRSSISVVTLVIFILAIATLQILSIVISDTPQSVYGQTQATDTYNNNNIVRWLSWTSPWYDNNLKPTTSNVITIAASISDNGNINSTPFLLPSPSSSRSSNNNNDSSTPAVGPASNTSPSNANVVNPDSPSQGQNSTNTHHDSHSTSQTNILSSNTNHIENLHKKHKHGSTVDIINQVVSQSKGQFTGGEIPFP